MTTDERAAEIRAALGDLESIRLRFVTLSRTSDHPGERGALTAVARMLEPTSHAASVVREVSPDV